MPEKEILQGVINLGSRLDDLDAKLVGFSGQFKDVTKSIHNLEDRVEEVAEQVHLMANQVDKRFDAVDKRFEDLEGSLRAEIRQVNENLGNKIDLVNSKVDFLAVKLVDKNVITRADASEIMHYDPKSQNSGHATA